MVAMILLPGLDGTGHLFADFVAAFGPEVKTTVVSYPLDAPLGYADLEPIVRSFLPTDQQYYLLAESFSGPIAISIAASSPPGLRGLILCCSFASSPLPLPALLHPAVRVAPVSVLPMALLSFFLLGRFASPSLRGALARSLSLVSPAVLRTRACAALSVDVSALLPRIKVPVLYLRASEDRIVHKSSSERIASLAQDARIAEFTAPHFLLQVVPSQTASSVAGFMGIGNEV